MILSLQERMLQLWKSGGELERMQVTGLFYQFVSEQFRQLQLGGAQQAEPDLAEQIARYIREYYRQPLSMTAMAELFHYSAHHLVRVFKRKYDCSPMEYVSRTRMQQARTLLAGTDAPIRHVAESVGYTDFYYFSRLFKKLYGETPAQFKMHAPLHKGSIPTNDMPESFIAPAKEQRYIDISDNHYQYRTWSVNDLKVSHKPPFCRIPLIQSVCAACSLRRREYETRSSSNKNIYRWLRQTGGNSSRAWRGSGARLWRLYASSRPDAGGCQPGDAGSIQRRDEDCGEYRGRNRQC